MDPTKFENAGCNVDFEGINGFLLGFLPWGFLKSQVKVNNTQSIDTLKIKIKNQLAQIWQDLCSRVIENWITRTHAAVSNCGDISTLLIFKRIWAFEIK